MGRSLSIYPATSARSHDSLHSTRSPDRFPVDCLSLALTSLFSVGYSLGPRRFVGFMIHRSHYAFSLVPDLDSLIPDFSCSSRIHTFYILTTAVHATFVYSYSPPPYPHVFTLFYPSPYPPRESRSPYSLVSSRKLLLLLVVVAFAILASSTISCIVGAFLFLRYLSFMAML